MPVRFRDHHTPTVKDPIFLEGLPGMGNVGKLAAQQVVDTLDATLWCDIFSNDLPPQVTVNKDGTVRLVRNQLWTIPADGEAPPLVVMTGDYQPLTSPGMFAVVEAVLERIDALGSKRMFTLGGFGTGEPVPEPVVLGAATDKEMVSELEQAGVIFDPNEPAGGIIGASGLFLGLGMERKMRGACLMGETSGYDVDPAAARLVLEILGKLTGRTFDVESLEERAKELDRVAQQVHEAEAAAKEPSDLHYIG